MDQRAKAKDLLTHYFRLIAGKTGIYWDANNDAEVEAIVDEIIEAAKAEIVALQRQARAGKL